MRDSVAAALEAGHQAARLLTGPSCRDSGGSSDLVIQVQLPGVALKSGKTTTVTVNAPTLIQEQFTTCFTGSLQPECAQPPDSSELALPNSRYTYSLAQFPVMGTAATQ